MALVGTKALQVWCKKVTEGYANVNILNMTTSWRSGMAFCAIIHHHCPELIDYDSLDPDDVFGNNSLAFNIAEQQLGIPSLLDPQDMVECELLDRLSILTYLAQYFQAFSTPNSPIKANIRPAGLSTSASSDLTDAAKLQMKNPLMGRQSDPCRLCGKPVFILERLNVGGKILHRTCFKCARCQDQLTLASFYETETGQFCCEVCPDEETRERERTLRVNKDLAKLMAGDSGESEDEGSDMDSSIVSGSIVDKDDKDCEGNDVLSNEAGIEFTVEYDSLEKKIDDLDIENFVRNEENCDNAAFTETTKDIHGSSNNLHFDNNKEEKFDEVEMQLSHDDDHKSEKIIEEEKTEISELRDETDTGHEKVEENEVTQDNVGDEYPDENNPFGEDDDDDDNVPEEISSGPITACETSTTLDKTGSLNPFGSDLESDEEISNPPSSTTNTINTSNSKITVATPSLNPFGSDLDSDEELPKPAVSPTPSVRHTLNSRKKRPAPLPPSQNTPVPAPRFSLSNTSRSSSPGSRSSLHRKANAAPVPPAETAKRLKDVDNLNRRSQIMEDIRKATSPTNIEPSIIPEQTTPKVTVTSTIAQENEPNKADEGQWRKKKGPAPPRPLPPKRSVKKLARKAINQELFDIEVKQGGLERQGVKLEKSIREICAVSDAKEGADTDSLGPEAEDLIIQLFDLVNEKNELFRRQTELIYMKKENRLEELHADCEYQIRILMSKPECMRTDDDKMSEERLIAKLVEIVTQRNEIVDCLEMDRLRELDEDTAIEDHLSDYAAVQPTQAQKKGLIKILKRKKKKKDKDKDDEKDVDTSEVKDDQASQEKPKKKSAKKKLISLASKKLPFPHKK